MNCARRKDGHATAAYRFFCSLRSTSHAPAKGQAQTLARKVLASIRQLELGAAVLARALLWGLVNWWADVACLTFAMLAAGITGLSIGKILLVWTAGAGAASLSPTPAGIGAVEAAMVAALTAAGVINSHAVTAIVVYRAISLKGAVTIWALLYRYLRQRRRRLHSGRVSALCRNTHRPDAPPEQRPLQN